MVMKCFMVFSFKDGDFSGECKGGVDASNETVWATQKAMAELFGVDLSGVSRHISNIYDIGELERDTTLAKFATLVQSGFRGTISKEIEYYNLDVIIAVGYRINSVRATAFRKWATSTRKLPTQT